MTGNVPGLDETVRTLTERLLEKRTAGGHWEGRLSSSALSTATATVALHLHERAAGENHVNLVSAGLRWLCENQNPDGGWGDTVIDVSNLSTTLLAWAALSWSKTDATAIRAIENAERWLRGQIGDLSAPRIRDAIVKRYGKDRTFSVPILTMLALSKRLGAEDQAWKLVPQLPFELAAFPHSMFRWLRLPVVSYALPALVAIGQIRHHRSPSHNPALAVIRSTLRTRTLRKAREMQPASGGYLEAAPLTSFVAMSLIASGSHREPIVTDAVRFLTNSVRPDGSWPIDTNLATWVTTLSVDALQASALPADDRTQILHWLLAQQAREEHPFTRAKPGGWAWTDLPGGVPDADDTAGALVALHKLAGPAPIDAAVAGVRWLLELQNSDGGIPTFCRGWGALPFDRSAPDLTAHALEAWSAWYDAVPSPLQRRISWATKRAVTYLERVQQADGSWSPLWFGNQHAHGELNWTYGTSRVVVGLTAPLVRRLSVGESARRRGVDWLARAQNADGGWGGAPGVQSSIEETGAALEAAPSQRGVEWLIAATDKGRRTPPTPIGLYFARLWYYEELYPLVFALRGLNHTNP
jgi:squalene-hopene/tetraprenyl-beta-curcumene cyclase